MEQRSFDATLELRTGEGGESSSRTLSGYAAVFGAWSEDLGGFRERLERGAFRSAMSGDVRALWNHDAAFVLGRTTNGTLRLEEDERGLKVEIDAPVGALYDGFLENVRRGDVTQMSFGFSVLEDEKSYGDDGQRLRVLKQVRLYEVSPVTFPAYTQTEVSLREWGERQLLNAESVELVAEVEDSILPDTEVTAETEETENTERNIDNIDSDGASASDESVDLTDGPIYAATLRQRRIRMLKA